MIADGAEDAALCFGEGFFGFSTDCTIEKGEQVDGYVLGEAGCAEACEAIEGEADDPGEPGEGTDDDIKVWCADSFL